MPGYIIGIIAALVGTGFHAGANILDNYFSDKIFNRLANLIFFSALINLIFLPVVFLLEKPGTVSFYSLGLIFLISAINILYQYPYYTALQKTDTSIVSSLFSLGKIFTPLLAFTLVKEHLKPIQYAGFFIIILSSVFLTFDRKQFRIKKEFTLMLFVSVILSVQSVLFKFLYERGVTWGTSVIWITTFDFILSAVFVLFPKNYADIKTSAEKIKSAGWLLVSNQFLTWGGEMTGLYALCFIPVSVFEGISSIQPVIVLLIAILLSRKKPIYFKEFTDRKNLGKKILFFSLMILGTLMVI